MAISQVQRRTGVVYIAPSVGPDVSEIAQMLEASGLLRLLVSRVLLAQGLRRVSAKVGFLTLSRRPVRPVKKSLTRTDSLADFIDLWGRLFGRNYSATIDKAFARVDALAARELDRTVAAVIGREDSCVQSFRTARELGVKTIYQLPTAFYGFVKQLIELEATQFPDVCVSARDEYEYAPARCERKEEELRNAQYVLCPSTFVERSLPSSVTADVMTIPLGVDAHAWSSLLRPKEPLFLYVGNVSLRKGVHRILLAWKRLKAYRTHRLRLVGEMRLSSLFLRDFAGMYEWTSRIPRSDLIDHYSSAQAFVFNALADGFGHVFAEAMSCGTAVLCSRNSGAPDLVTDGIEGRLFDYGDDEQLASTLEWALSNPAELEQMGSRARERASLSEWKNFAAIFLPWISSIAASSVPGNTGADERAR